MSLWCSCSKIHAFSYSIVFPIRFFIQLERWKQPDRVWCPLSLTLRCATAYYRGPTRACAWSEFLRAYQLQVPYGNWVSFVSVMVKCLARCELSSQALHSSLWPCWQSCHMQNYTFQWYKNAQKPKRNILATMPVQITHACLDWRQNRIETINIPGNKTRNWFEK